MRFLSKETEGKVKDKDLTPIFSANLLQSSQVGSCDGGLTGNGLRAILCIN